MSAVEFHVGDIISVISGVLVSPTHIGGVHKILDHLTSDVLLTHQLPRASRESEDHLRRQHPDLAAIEIPDWSSVPTEGMKDAVFGWLASVVAEHGETRMVEPMPEVDHTRIDPISELRMKHPGAAVIAIHGLEGGAS